MVASPSREPASRNFAVTVFVPSFSDWSELVEVQLVISIAAKMQAIIDKIVFLSVYFLVVFKRYHETS